MAAEIIASGEPNWPAVARGLTGEIPEGKSIFYQKQMTHHLLREVDRSWLARVTNCFLIRHPREVITSYIAKNNDPTVEDVGFIQQAEIFDWVRKTNIGLAGSSVTPFQAASGLAAWQEIDRVDDMLEQRVNYVQDFLGSTEGIANLLLGRLFGFAVLVGLLGHRAGQPSQVVPGIMELIDQR
jgi:hypothetical protein